MRTIDGMMPIFSICHGQGLKMNFFGFGLHKSRYCISTNTLSSMPVSDEETHQATCPEQVANSEVSNHQYVIVLDKYLDELVFLNPDRVKEAFNDMNSYTMLEAQMA